MNIYGYKVEIVLFIYSKAKSMNKNYRPKPNPLQRTYQEWTYEIIGLIALAVMIGYPLVFYSQIPERIPIHFNLFGEADGYGSKSVIWILIGIGFISFIGLNAILKIPHEYNYPVKVTEENAQVLYRMTQHYMIILKVVFVILFSVITILIVETGIQGATQWWARWAFGICLICIILPIIRLIRQSKRIAKQYK